MEEFALCWNKLKFAENLSTGFQSLFDRGDFVDCTIACDGQLLQCHKIVLAICSPYFKEIFISSPCRHPIIILKDVSFSIMSELLQFMYQGEVNVKQAELQAFMSIAESLQIKGLATNASNNNSQTLRGSDAANSTSYSQFQANNVVRNHNQHQFNSGGNQSENNRPASSTPLSTSSVENNHSMKGLKMGETPSYGQKRSIDQLEARQSQMKMKRGPMTDISDSDMNDSIDNIQSDEMFLPQGMQPQVTINESPRFDANVVKRETNEQQPQSPSTSGSYRGSYQNPNANAMHNATFPYNFPEFSSNNDLTMQNEMKPSIHMDIPAGTSSNFSNVTMLSATSLLHNSMIFNRNNTVATTQGMKTYWLCRSYRLTTCRARCITAQGRIMSTTGTHNHPPHVKNATSTKTDVSGDQHSNVQQAFAQPMSNQISNMPSATVTAAMINQQQMSANINFGSGGGGSGTTNNNNFSMTNILNTQNLSDIDPSSILTQTSAAGLNQLDSNIQITPIINASIDNLQMQQQQQHQRNVMNASNMHVDTTITSANN